MQTYRNRNSEYMRRGNCARGCRNTAGGAVPASLASYEEKNTPCCDRDDELAGMPPAMAYVPWQNWRKVYDVQRGLSRGTIFEELDKPFCGKGGCGQ